MAQQNVFDAASRGFRPANDSAVAGLGRFQSRKLVFDSGLVSVDDPRILAMHEGYDDLVKIFDQSSVIC